MKKLTYLLLALLAISGCQTSQVVPDDPLDEAKRIARESIIIDTHIDVPYRLYFRPADVSAATDDGEFDFLRAKIGGLNAPFMSIYIPALVDEAGNAFRFAENAIDSMEQLSLVHPAKFAKASCTKDVVRHFEEGLISLPLGMENGGPIEGKISNLEHFYNRGIRYITLAHSKSNHISDSSYDPNERWQGLSAFGKELIGHMNRMGVMVDVSHISDAAFWQVLELTEVPVIASHSSLRYFTPRFQRNMSDDMVKALAANGGVIHINYGSSFLHQASQDYSAKRTAALKAYQNEQHLPDGDPALAAFLKEYTAANPYPFADLKNVLDHIDRAVELAGIDGVGIGSDYDGVGDTLPTGLKDVSTYPNLIQGLIQRGYSEQDIKKILGENTLRVWRAVEDYATAQGTTLRCSS